MAASIIDRSCCDTPAEWIRVRPPGGPPVAAGGPAEAAGAPETGIFCGGAMGELISASSVSCVWVGPAAPPVTAPWRSDRPQEQRLANASRSQHKRARGSSLLIAQYAVIAQIMMNGKKVKGAARQTKVASRTGVK